MTGWNAAKVETFKTGFTEFLQYIQIDSKDTGGGTILGDAIYYAQQRFLDAVWRGLSRDVHNIDALKSRQLGISTICKPLVLFWMGIHDGLQGAMIFDTDAHKESARRSATGRFCISWRPGSDRAAAPAFSAVRPGSA